MLDVLIQLGKLAIVGLSLVVAVARADTFTITDIRLQGLQRVSAGTVFNELPVNVGDTVDELTVRQLIRLLFATGYFNDIRMARDNDVETVKALHRRIVNTAKRTCPSYSEVRSVRVVRECKQAAVNDLVGKIDRPSLSAYVKGESEIRIAELIEQHRGNA